MAVTTHLAQLVAERWRELLRMDRAHIETIIATSTLTDDDLMKLLSDKNVYPQITGSADGTYTIKIMADGQFPQVINTNKLPGAIDAYDIEKAAVVPGVHGVLGQPENNAYFAKNVPQPTPVSTPPSI